MRSPDKAFDLRAALTQEVRGAIEEFDAAGEYAPALHRCRVRLKRARAVAHVGRACAPGLSAVFNDSARAAMHALARARTEIALEAAATKAADRTGKKSAAEALEAVASSLSAPKGLEGAAETEAARAALRDLLALAQVWPEASPRQIKKGALRIVRRANRAHESSDDDPHTRHQWRKREKDRAYAAQLLGGAWPRRRRLKLASKLGDVLGDERDALLLMARVAADPALAGTQKAAEKALKALNKRRAKLARRADELGARLHAR
ncbi:MAG: CHAD domain-containing protein [Hyphomonadaceae bacterium]